MPPPSEYRILDKDLTRLTHAEQAQVHAFQPVWRLGLGLIVAVAGLLVFMSFQSGVDQNIAISAAVVVAVWLGLAIGSNDVANSLGPAVGAGAIGVLPGLFLVAMAELAGASLGGGAVTQRLAGGIFNLDMAPSAFHLQVLMLGALIGAASWITLATGIGLPVSTSHSIVGAISGASVAAMGVFAVKWSVLATIASAWVVSPLIAAGLAGGVLILITLRVAQADNREAAALRWIPALVGVMVGLFGIYLSLLISRRLDVPLVSMQVASLLIAGPAAWAMRRRLVAEFSRIQSRPRLKHLFRPPLVVAVVIMAFAHGANDVGNVAGPLSVILPTGAPHGASQVPIWVLAGAGLAIALGTLLFGRRLVVMVGSGITRLNPVRAFCVSLATAATVLIASGAGLPVSTTHVAVGGIFGVGFAREWLDRQSDRQRDALPIEERRRRRLIRRSHVATMTAAWLVTVPVTALLGGVAYLLVAAANGL